jgi:hypothetical protein
MLVTRRTRDRGGSLRPHTCGIKALIELMETLGLGDQSVWTDEFPLGSSFESDRAQPALIANAV